MSGREFVSFILKNGMFHGILREILVINQYNLYYTRQVTKYSVFIKKNEELNWTQLMFI